MRFKEFVIEKASAATCRKGNEGGKIGISAKSSCVSQGLMPHKSHHTDGSGKQGKDGSGKSLNGKTVKGEKYGGKVKDYGKNR
jgi:hypothetical protein